MLYFNYGQVSFASWIGPKYSTVSLIQSRHEQYAEEKGKVQEEAAECLLLLLFSDDIHSNGLDKRSPMIFPGQCLPDLCCRHLSYLATICLIWQIDSAAELQRQPFLCSSARRTFRILVFFVCN